MRLVLPLFSEFIRLCVTWGYILDLLYIVGVNLSFILSAFAHFQFLYNLRGHRGLHNLPVPLGSCRLASNRFLVYLPYEGVHSVALSPASIIFLLVLVYVDIVLTYL